MTRRDRFQEALLLPARRQAHVEAVAIAASCLFPTDAVVHSAALLHDVGYADELVDTGMHALDGARWLREQGEPGVVVSLVAWHTGARFEAEERGLLAELEEFPEPPQDLLDALNLCDLITSPTGEEVDVEDRIAEILRRYPPGHPVHRAVMRSRPVLIESCRRAIGRLGLAEGWGLTAL